MCCHVAIINAKRSAMRLRWRQTEVPCGEFGTNTFLRLQFYLFTIDFLQKMYFNFCLIEKKTEYCFKLALAREQVLHFRLVFMASCSSSSSSASGLPTVLTIYCDASQGKKGKNQKGF